MQNFEKKENQVTIDINFLEPSPLNNYEIGDLSDLEGNILACGVITPLSVIGPNPDGKYTILSGERRYRSVLNINESGRGNISELPCYIIGNYDMPELEQKLIIESSNIETRDFDKNEHRFQLVGVVKKLAEEKGVKHTALADMMATYLKVSKRYGSMYLQIFERGSDELKNLIRNKKITVTEASRVNTMTPEEQEEVIGKINKGVKPRTAINEQLGILNDDNKNEKKKSQEESNQIDLGEDELDVSDDEIVRSIASGKSEGVDKYSMFDAYASGTSVVCDTTGEIDKLRNESENEADYNNLLRKIIGWSNKMKKKSEFTEEELEAVDALRDLIIYMDDCQLLGN